jgi:glycosyltransferase involved in cell wall biosynthesis
MRICLVLTSRYPTEKAYGVTTGETARQLRDMGNVVEIISPMEFGVSKELDSYGNKIWHIRMPFSEAMRKKMFKIRWLKSIFFLIYSIVFTVKSSRELKRNRFQVIWLRDFWAALILQKILRDSTFVLEVHKNPRYLNRIALQYLIKNSKIALLAIQKSMQMKLQVDFPNSNVFYGPMGARSDFYSIGTKKIIDFETEPLSRPLKVCYLGRMTSSGQDNGLVELIKSWSELPSEVASLTLIGVSENEVLNFLQKEQLKNICFEDSVAHNRVPEHLLMFDVGIIPYPEDSYHRTRFPIKAVEYSAAALNIVASNTKGNHEILDEKFCYFYDIGNSYELKRVLLDVRTDRRKAMLRVQDGFKWAKGYTYESRVSDIYPFLQRCVN